VGGGTRLVILRTQRSGSAHRRRRPFVVGRHPRSWSEAYAGFALATGFWFFRYRIFCAFMDCGMQRVGDYMNRP